LIDCLIKTEISGEAEAVPAGGDVNRNILIPARDIVDYWNQRPWRMADGGLRPI